MKTQTLESLWKLKLAAGGEEVEEELHFQTKHNVDCLKIFFELDII